MSLLEKTGLSTFHVKVMHLLVFIIVNKQCFNPKHSWYFFIDLNLDIYDCLIYLIIQELITKKIEELKCPGDDEFAEYIIVMLHNDKTAVEVQAELEPFLGKQSAVFTPW